MLPEWQKKILRYCRNVLFELDEFVSTLTGGQKNETISFRVARAKLNGSKFGCVFCKFLDVFEKDHCQKSYDKKMGEQPKP